MSTDTTYRGWRTSATWQIQRQLETDEQTRDEVRALAHRWLESPLAEKSWRECGGSDEWLLAESRFSDVLREYVTDRACGEDKPENVWGKLRADAVVEILSRVHWEQLAAHWLEVARHEIEQEATA